MKQPSTLQVIFGLPRFLGNYATNPIKRAILKAAPVPNTQTELARLVEKTFHHEIRAGFEHRLIRLMFVTVDDRVFCRQYQFGARSWRDVFLSNPEGQVRLDDTAATITAHEPKDYHQIIPAVDQAYVDALRKIGAGFLLTGSVEPRAQESTMEIKLAAA